MEDFHLGILLDRMISEVERLREFSATKFVDI